MSLRLFSSRLSAQGLSPAGSLSPALANAAVDRWSQFTLNASAVSQSLLRPAAVTLNIPGILSDIWESVLRAVPKKKTSHMKKRHRQMAGKALKDVKSLSTCSGCGQIKRSHVLCPNCVASIKKQWGRKNTE
ncbi:WD domain-containing protein [Aspergillus japonicus CBS 114.51]|uniref:Large ribosomal subunit protein bL32m n=2 Tax=Aspergillus TaxID=5052 RepID=A0A2V5HR89_ASPV1|nr:WD domain-containing protein [Aspergillus japonicus CBS 114.51]PYI18800.1 WD domain-containing protein [Aspergillus violaceofuscus CBS 115571]RAH81037.1 WD domain-containing protein [Aspergillus japonicus CBS 114.51]